MEKVVDLEILKHRREDDAVDTVQVAYKQIDGRFNRQIIGRFDGHIDCRL